MAEKSIPEDLLQRILKKGKAGAIEKKSPQQPALSPEKMREVAERAKAEHLLKSREPLEPPEQK